jgi:hypothetical protein
MKVTQSRFLKSGPIREGVGDGAIFGCSTVGLVIGRAALRFAIRRSSTDRHQCWPILCTELHDGFLIHMLQKSMAGLAIQIGVRPVSIY